MRAILMAWILAALAGVSGCATGGALRLPGVLERPGTVGAVPAAGPSSVAVLDFSFGGSPPYEIGRDYDRARSIVWGENPGKAVADLVADVLNERGVSAVRVAAGSGVPAEAAARVWGNVDTFRVEARKMGSMRVEVEIRSSVAVTVQGEGGSAPPGWKSTVASEYVMTDPLFVTAASVGDAVNAAANAVAEEAVRRLATAGVVAMPLEPSGPTGAPHPGGPGGR